LWLASFVLEAIVPAPQRDKSARVLSKVHSYGGVATFISAKLALFLIASILLIGTPSTLGNEEDTILAAQ